MESKTRERIREAAREMLGRNRRQGYDRHYRTSFSYTCPSPGRYHWQWFWDSCFAAVALSHLDIEQAKAELVSLVAPQQPDGFIGHVAYWGKKPFVEVWGHLQSRPLLRPRHTQLIQPPVLAQAALQVFERSLDKAFLMELLPRIDRYYRWLGAHRDSDCDSLISIISPYESGMDHKPAYDSVLGFKPGRAGRRDRVELELRNRLLDLSNLRRGFDSARVLARGRFDVEDVMVNSVYAQGMRSLAALHRAAGHRREADAWEREAERTGAALLSKCYDESAGAFWDLAGAREMPLRVLTVTALFPLVLPDTPREVVDRLVRDHLLSPREFWPRYPAPSVALSEPTCKPDSARFLWRGPTWLNTNWFLFKGLRLHGYTEAAGAVRDASIALVEREGFREFYDPLTGRGMRSTEFTWSALVVDMME